MKNLRRYIFPFLFVIILIVIFIVNKKNKGNSDSNDSPTFYEGITGVDANKSVIQSAFGTSTRDNYNRQYEQLVTVQNR